MTHGWTTRLATAVLAATLATSAHAMHVETCDGPYAFQSLDVTTLPPGHAKKIRADLDRALEHPGTLRQLLKRYPAEVVAAWRLNPETARQALVAPEDRARILAAAGEGFSACIPQEVVMGGTPVSAVEQRPDRPYYVDAIQRLDGRYFRLNAQPQSYRQDRPVTVRGWQMGHDLLVETLEQDGEVVADEIWNDYIRANTPTTGTTYVNVFGFTFDGSVDTPTYNGLMAMVAQAATRARENSDPDGPGPLPPSWQPIYQVHPAIIDLGDTTGCDWVCIAQRVQMATGWSATRAGDAFHVVGDGGNLSVRWNFGGVNFLGGVNFQGSTPLVNLGASITRAGSGTLNHEVQHGLAGHHEEGIGGCLYEIPGLQGLVSPCYLQPYGFRVGTLGASSVDAANSPGLQIDLWKWTPESMVREITGPGRYTIRGYRQDGTLPSVLRLRRSSRPSDFLYIAAWKDAPRAPSGARTGAFFQTRTGGRWWEPLTVNCQSASTGHLDTACQVGTMLVEPITGYRLTVESETPTSLTVNVEAGDPVTTTTFPPTTTSTLAPSTLIVSLSTTPYPLKVGVASDLRAWVRRADETTLRVPEAVEWIAPVSSTTNPTRWTPMVAGWVDIEVRVRDGGVWSVNKRFQLLVDPATTTTSTAPPTTSTSSTTSTTSTTGTLPPTTSTSTTTTTVPGQGYTEARIVGPATISGPTWSGRVEARREGGPWEVPACCFWKYSPDAMAATETVLPETCPVGTYPCTASIGSASAPFVTGAVEGWAYQGDGGWLYAGLLRVMVTTGSTTSTSLAPSTTSTSTSSSSTSTSRPPTTTSTSSTTSTTGTLPPTTSTSTSSSTSTSRPPTTTSTSSTTSSTIGTTTSTSSTSTSTVLWGACCGSGGECVQTGEPECVAAGGRFLRLASCSASPCPTTTTTTLPPTCAEEGQLCNRHADCRQSPGCEEYQCNRKWWHIWDRRKRCAPRGRPRGGRKHG